MLRFNARIADKGSTVSDVRRIASAKARRRDHESGQVLVEFALLLPLFVLLVAGIIQFGLALNFWLDMQRIANQGARWAVVNNWPTCPPGSTSCTNETACPLPATPSPQTLRNILKCEVISKGLLETVSVFICYPPAGAGGSPPETVGTPVRVRLKAPFTFLQAVRLPGITLSADATMRLEQEPKLITNEVAYPC